MKKNFLLIASISLPIVFFVAWVSLLEYKIRNAPEITIRAEGYDPRSLISGHYLMLRLNWQETDCRQFGDNLCHPGRFKSVYNYYLPEMDAIYLDRIISSQNPKIELVFAYTADKTPYLKRLLIDGEPWKKWVAKNK